MINWKVRIRNKYFWLAIIPAAIVLVKALAAVFGYTLDLGDVSQKLIDVVEAVFVILSILGIVNDPTTEGWDDSKLAMTYEQPKKKGA